MPLFLARGKAHPIIVAFLAPLLALLAVSGAAGPVVRAVPSTVGSVPRAVGGIQEIRALKTTSHDGFPRLPLGFEKRFDLKDVAENVVQRSVDEYAKAAQGTPQKEGTKVDLWTEPEIQILFPSESLSTILKEGFLNQHQTEVSRGTYDPYERLLVESQMAQIHFDGEFERADFADPRLSLLPKYGLLALPPGRHPEILPDEDVGRYGDAVAVLKNEVKRRSTWTATDSKDRWGRIEPSALTGPAQIPHGLTRYLEAQVWGPLDLRDVQEFRVSPSAPRHVLRLLQETGIPIYLYEPAKKVQRDRYELLHPGHARKRRRQEQAGGLLPQSDVESLKRIRLSEIASYPPLTPWSELESPTGRRLYVAGGKASHPVGGVTHYKARSVDDRSEFYHVFVRSGPLSLPARIYWLFMSLFQSESGDGFLLLRAAHYTALEPR